MSRGIYILANDKVIDNAIALLESIRLYDSETPVVMIPYDNNYTTIAKVVTTAYGVKIYENLHLVESIIERARQLWKYRNPTQGFQLLRKFACWFGCFDEFLYLDTDIIVFEKIIDTLNYLSDWDFICCDYQANTGIQHVFTDKVLEDKIFTEQELQDIFNAGFWGSKKNLFSLEELFEVIGECASMPEYFYWSYLDQSLLNYLVLKRIPRHFNLVRRADNVPGSWAGSKHFKFEGGRLYDSITNKPLQYLHWAGIRIEPGCSYWDVWEHYRYLNTPKPARYPQIQRRRSFGERILNRLKQLTKRI
ncbi:MAG: methionine synthase [Oscillatoriaceae bacterium SKYG93]|nr:methionine synthase [Oscillatoriaceae bacterium SKYG93]MDW8452523.1 methionine synthase [Oscillatoriaceae cyanobacterium SKYGB_i_bin93]